MQQHPFPHLEQIVIDNFEYECVVMKRDAGNGDLYYIKVLDMDDIDRQRMRTLLLKREARSFDLWDLLANNTLPNGCNALEYFDQYVKGITANGHHFKPMMGRRGPMMVREDARVAAQAALAAQTHVETSAPPATGKSKKSEG